MPFDENQYQWEEVSSEQEKPQKSMPTWVKWAAIGIGVIILIVAAIFLIRGMVNRFSEGEKQEEMEVQMSRAEAECLNAQDQEKCLSQVAFRLASDHGDPDYCDDIEAVDERDECYLVAALVSMEQATCDEIADKDAQATCIDSILAQALDPRQDGIEACEGFSQSADRENCLSTHLLEAVLAGDCPNADIDQQTCDYGTIINRAILNENPDLCEDIDDEEYFGTCLEYVTVIDRDQDGLTEQEEQGYGTDDRNPDTDGDGFNDKQEIDNGYDPLS